MRRGGKPVNKCYTCLLNMGDHCWFYQYPRGQWRSGKTCSAFENDEAYRQFKEWQKQPIVKTRKELRREFFRRKLKPVTWRGNRSD
jgi:hypothetical protein